MFTGMPLLCLLQLKINPLINVVTILYWLYRVEFEDVHRLSDGQVKHSPEVFYAGSLWKVVYSMIGLSVHINFYTM